MEAIKAGIEKAKEASQNKKAEENYEKAHDPTVKPSERLDAEFEANKASVKAAEHHIKAEQHRTKHIAN